MFTSKGKLIYDPHARIKSAPWWSILKCDEGLISYYKYWIQKRYDVKFEKTVWGSHISINRGIKPPNPAAWGKYKGEVISFTYSNRIYRVNNWFYCIDAYSERVEEIRLELGLPALPPHGLHLTIARINKPYAEERQNLFKSL